MPCCSESSAPQVSLLLGRWHTVWVFDSSDACTGISNQLSHRMTVWKRCQAVQPYTVLPFASQALHMPKLLTPNQSWATESQWTQVCMR